MSPQANVGLTCQAKQDVVKTEYQLIGFGHIKQQETHFSPTTHVPYWCSLRGGFGFALVETKASPFCNPFEQEK